MAEIIQTNIRSTDVGARWGGEELAIYLPRVALETGVQIAERLVKKVRESSSPKVTISCGVSHWKKEDKIPIIHCLNVQTKRYIQQKKQEKIKWWYIRNLRRLLLRSLLI